MRRKKKGHPHSEKTQSPAKQSGTSRNALDFDANPSKNEYFNRSSQVTVTYTHTAESRQSDVAVHYTSILVQKTYSSKSNAHVQYTRQTSALHLPLGRP